MREQQGFQVHTIDGNRIYGAQFVLKDRVHIDDKVMVCQQTTIHMEADGGLNWCLKRCSRLLIAYSYSWRRKMDYCSNRLPEHILTITSNLTF